MKNLAPDWLAKRAELSPDRVALTDINSGKESTFKQWNKRVSQTANLLTVLNIKKGDLVSVLSSNCVEYMDVFFACNKTGAILHNLNWRLTVFELKAIMEEAEPKILFYSQDWQTQAAELKKNFPELRMIPFRSGSVPSDGVFEERESLPVTYQSREVYLDDPWGIYYTGGTTGIPKGAILTHGNMFWNSVNTVTSWNLNWNHIAPLQLPFFHIGGPNIFMLPLVHVGGKTILAKEFNPDQTFDMIEKGHMTHYVGVPTMYIMLQKHSRWEEADFSRLELVISGGAPCPLPVMKKFWDRGIDFKMGYGLTEASGNNFWLPPGQAPNKPGSVGFPIFHIQMKIMHTDENGKVIECSPNEPGELWIKGGHVSVGYFKRPDETEKVFEDGWLKTGDTARKNEQGYFYIMGRSKEMFISGGENVYPAEVESAIHAHPKVAEAALVPIPDETWGEVGRAFVVANKGAQLDTSEVLQFLKTRLAKYKIPKSIIFLEQLPKTVIGKLDKKKLMNWKT